ncbi:MAG: GNAT family N-acetyltransferase [Planctomycetota bacterium]
MDVSLITLEDDLAKLVGDINRASWDNTNGAMSYGEDGLRAYLERQDTFLLTCYEQGEDSKKLLGIASARILIKPYAKELWLYVDEVDVCSDQRRRGVGRKMMEKLLLLARENGCEEVWLGAELKNDGANVLYHSLNPSEVSELYGYTYKII